MIPPKKFSYVNPPRQEPTIHLRPDNLQRMKDRLDAIKGLAKSTAFRRIAE